MCSLGHSSFPQRPLNSSPPIISAWRDDDASLAMPKLVCVSNRQTFECCIAGARWLEHTKESPLKITHHQQYTSGKRVRLTGVNLPCSHTEPGFKRLVSESSWASRLPEFAGFRLQGMTEFPSLCFSVYVFGKNSPPSQAQSWGIEVGACDSP